MNRLKNILAQRLEAGQRVLPEHLSPDALSGFLEQRLLASERERTLHHLAACRICRDAVTLAAAEIADSAEVGITKTRARFASWGSLRWASAAAALAVAIGAGVLVHERQPVSHSQIRTAESVAPVASEPSNAAAENREPPAPSTASSPASGSKQSAAQLAQNHFGKTFLQSKSSRSAHAQIAPSLRPSHVEMASAQPVSPAVPEGAASSNAVVAAPVPAEASADLTLTDQNVAKEQEAVGKKDLRATALTGTARARSVDGELVSWRVSSSGQLERRSQDGGLTLIEPAPGFSARTIAARGIEVWAAGPNRSLPISGNQDSGDTLYHSSDAGQTWTQVAGPWRQPIQHVSMLPQGAISVATQSSSWITRDGGQSWKQTSRQ
ncbi:MAG TPA: hypothetical protein VFQ00_03955 [Terriglobales bacterium]|nr:hypothetical protein [Terriglobales bacterium]